MTEQPLIDISPENWRIVRDILQRHVPDRGVWAFGSRAKWTAKEFSDLDIAIIGDEPLSLSVMAELSESFQDSALPFKVDVVDWAAITQSFRKVVEKDRIVLIAVSKPRETSFIRFGDLFSEPQKNGLTRPKKVRGTGLPMVNMGELFAYTRIKNIQMDLVPVSEKEKSFLLENGDLLFARQSLVRDGAGQCSIFLGNTTPTVFESHIIRCRLNPKVADPEFYYYLFLAPKGREAIEAIIEQGAGAAGIRGSDLVNIQVPYFPVEQQKRVSRVLSAIDDRIDLLRETNATLEAIAQALFKSWFVDFDPVRAKAEGREPEGVPPEVAELFPSEFEDSDLGDIPKGWTAVPFGKLLGHAIGGDWGKDDADEEHPTAVAIVRGTDVPDIKVGNLDGVPRRFVSPKKLRSRRLQDGDLIIEVSGGSKTQATGRSLYCTDGLLDDFGMPVVPASFCRLFRPADKYLGVLLAIHLSSIYAAGKMWNYQVQSTGLANFQTTHFLESELVVVPSEPIREAFFNYVRPLIERQQTADIRTTASLRDTLLPRLMSGGLQLDTATSQYLSETSD